ncbi:LuxR C-terminal-related transcriptional regulator [Streptomyces sp. NPDC087908]|uniref:LuxR C-terminal-related transcriptional regulator n=1 Tax=Streptomyces sp. NPDC087908 TaxID=3365820 RepID=UPI00381B0B9B
MRTMVRLTHTWPFVGRDDELRAATEALGTSESGGVLFTGSTGTGKSRIAAEFLNLCAGEGLRTEWVVATAVSREVPLGALAPLLARGALMPDQHVGRAPAGCGLVLLVDDIHLLDQASRRLLTPLVLAGQIRLIGTTNSAQRDGDRAARSLRLTAIAVEPLLQEHVTTLLEEALRGPVERSTALHLYRVSKGRPLHLRELTLDAVQHGHLVQDAGVWRLSGPLHPSAKLAALVRRELTRLNERQRAALEDLALCGSVPTSELSDCTRGALESAGLVDVQGRHYVLADECQALVLRSSASLQAGRRILLARAERTEQAGPLDGQMLLQTTLWRVQAGEMVSPQRLLGAIEQARAVHDFPSGLILARALERVRRDCQTYLLLGEFGYECGQHREAQAALAQAQKLAISDEDWLAGIVLRTRALAHGMLRTNKALEVSRAALNAASTTAATEVLLANEAALLCFAGDVRGAGLLLESLHSPTSEAAETIAATPRVYWLSESGRTAEALRVARIRHPKHEANGQWGALVHPAGLQGVRARTVADAGRLNEAITMGRAAHDLAVNSKASTEQIWTGLHLGYICYLRGELQESQAWFSGAVALSREQEYAYGLWAGYGGRALTAALFGDTETARACSAQLAEHGSSAWRRPEEQLCRAWILASEGHLTKARQALQSGARLARRLGLLVTESHLLFDVARLGAPQAVTQRLQELAQTTDNPFVSLRAAAARSLLAPDGDELTKLGDTFQEFGSLLVAAEMFTVAAAALRSEGAARRAAERRAQAQDLLTRCAGIYTPAILLYGPKARLTPRELEIALLAAAGPRNTDIAEQLGLSARTVGNHLQHVYTKTGIGDRTLLRSALSEAVRAA